MSLERIFESARKLGVPVIVTDVKGREPFVIIPLEQFEALAGSSTMSVSEEVRSTPIEKKENMQAVAEEGSKEISLDERFYLEPLDEESGI